MIVPTRPVFNQNLFPTPGFDMIFVEGGSFTMGSGDEKGYGDEKPLHQVQIRDFWIAQYPVTQWLWEAVLGLDNPSNFKGKNRPVEQVSWYDAAVFCNALNLHCGYEPCYFSDEGFSALYGKTAEGFTLPKEGEVFRKPDTQGYRLPTEAEWEYAARGGKDPEKRPSYEYAGGEKLDELGWYSENSHGETKPVGLKLPNELGLYDMSGNVWEWCEDWYGPYPQGPLTDPRGPDGGTDRVYRGGGWGGVAGSCRSSDRGTDWPQDRFSYLGFRLVLFSPPG